MSNIDPRPRIVGCVNKSRPQIEVVDPYNRQAFQALDLADGDDVEQALKTSFQISKDRRQWLSGAKRVEILISTANKIEQDLERFTEDLGREGGKPRADARIEVIRAIDGLRNCAELLRSHGTGDAIATDINAASAHRVSFASHEPIGVVVAISAFNHPLNLAVHQIGPAVAAGCPFILKPSSSTPYSAYRLIDLMHECGLPTEYGQVLLTQGSALAQNLACDRRVAFFSFIGSANVGWMLRSKLAPGTRCALEHGGAAPVVVDKGVDIEKTAALLARGGFYHAGQVCISVQRVFAEQTIARDLAEAISRHGEKMIVGHQLDEQTGIGPMISPTEVERVHQWVNEAASAGAEVLSGAQAKSATCYPATVLWNPPENSRICCEEVFGPVVAVSPYADIDQAIAQANSLDYKFQAAVFSTNIDTALYCYRRLDASAVMINDHTAWRVDWMPFAGLGRSGYGVGGIPYTFEDMQTNKLAVIQSESL